MQCREVGSPHILDEIGHALPQPCGVPEQAQAQAEQLRLHRCEECHARGARLRCESVEEVVGELGDADGVELKGALLGAAGAREVAELEDLICRSRGRQGSGKGFCEGSTVGAECC